MSCNRSNDLRDRSGSAVEIKDHLILRLADVRARGIIEHLCAERIRLEEGERRDSKLQS